MRCFRAMSINMVKNLVFKKIYSIFAIMSKIYTDKEIWVDITGYEGIYQISNHGRVKSLDRMSTSGTSRLIRGRLFKTINDRGYHIRILADVGNGRKNLRIHREVARHFVHNPNPQDFDIINHIDGDGLNNHHSNLEWCTHLHNITHAINTGARLHSPHQVLNEEDIKEVRRLFDETDMTYTEIGNMYNCNGNSINLVVRYISYKHIEPEKKNTYKINYLKGKELKNWLKAKTPLKTIYDSLSKDELDKLVYEYCNTIIDLKSLVEKYNASYIKIKDYIDSLDKVPFVKLEGEIFKKFDDTYAFSNMGRIFNLKSKRLNKPITRLFKSQLNVKHIMAKLFLPNPNNYKQVKTLDGTNNFAVDNLEWIEYTIPNRVYVDIHAEIRNDVINDYQNTILTQKEIAKKYNVSKGSIETICRGIYKKEEFKNLISKDTAVLIRKLYLYDNVKVPELAKTYDVSIGYIYKVLKNEIWPDENNSHGKAQKNQIEIERLTKEGISIDKECPMCRVVKHRVYDFHKNKTLEDGRTRLCKDCIKKTQKNS